MSLPVAFISRGSPMLALDQGEWSQTLRAWATAPPEPEDWARRFEVWVEEGVCSGDLTHLLEAERLAPGFAEAFPTREHFDPLYFAVGAVGASNPSEFYRGWQLGNLSLRAWSWGG